MPNIMICGFEEEKAEELKGKIDYIMLLLGLEKKAITSIVEMRAETCDETRASMPYLRVCATDPAGAKRIVEALRNSHIGVDVEWLVLSGFVEAKDMR